MPKLLWVGDAGCPSGFAKATHYILDTLRHHYDVTVLGVNYRGDPHPFPYPIYAAAVGGDFVGVGRLIWMCDFVKPDVIVFQGDGWHIVEYVKQLKLFKEYADIPTVAIVAVDGKNFTRKWIEGVDHVVFWTQFALDEAQLAGFNGPASVIPLGVDTSIYAPMDKRQARRERGIEAAGDDIFVVGNVNRNQPRKRWDLTLQYFAEWALGENIANARLFLHAAPTGDMGVHVRQLATYYGLMNRLLYVEPPVWYGMSEQDMNLTYNCFDVSITTTQGEGFGLTTLEAMACRVPCIVPEWSALGDWAADAAIQVPCDATAIGPPYLNIIGGVPNKREFIAAMNMLYHHRPSYDMWADRAYAKAHEAQYSWLSIGQAYLKILEPLVEASHARQALRRADDDPQHKGYRQEVP